MAGAEFQLYVTVILSLLIFLSCVNEKAECMGFSCLALDHNGEQWKVNQFLHVEEAALAADSDDSLRKIANMFGDTWGRKLRVNNPEEK